MTPDSVIKVIPRADVVYAQVVPTDLDYESSGRLRSAVVAAGRQAPDRPLVLDMSSVELVPSVALGALITLTRIFQEHGQPFVVVGAKPEVRHMLKICNLERLFVIYDTVDQALDGLQAGSIHTRP